MNKQALAVIAGAIVLFAVAVIGAMAFTGGDSNPPGNVHTMQDGSTMTGPMTSTGETHTMEDGSMMDDMDMEP
jgi:hypothetical protein